MRNLTARDVGRPFSSLDDKRKVLHDFLFVTDTGHGNFLLFSDFYEGDTASNEVCSGQVRFLDSSHILFHFSLVRFTLILSHIIATRVGLDLSCMTCILKYSLTSAIK